MFPLERPIGETLTGGEKNCCSLWESNETCQ